MNNYVYILNGVPYINLTNRCANACEFCIRNTGDGVAGTLLWLDKEPTAADVIAAFDRTPHAVKQAVFCGYGEPTENMRALVGVAKELASRSYELRLNTNGLGNLCNGRNIVPELEDIASVSVSLNNHSAQKYAQLTHSSFGLRAFDGVIEFARLCKAAGKRTVFTVVDTIGERDIAECKKLCENLGIPLRVREYIGDNYNGGV